MYRALLVISQKLIFRLNPKYTGDCIVIAMNVSRRLLQCNEELRVKGYRISLTDKVKKFKEHLNLLSLGAGQGRDAAILNTKFDFVVKVDKKQSPYLRRWDNAASKMHSTFIIDFEKATKKDFAPIYELHNMFDVATLVFTINHLGDNVVKNLLGLIKVHVRYLIVIDSFGEEKDYDLDEHGQLRRRKEDLTSLVGSQGYTLVNDSVIFDGHCSQRSQC